MRDLDAWPVSSGGRAKRPREPVTTEPARCCSNTIVHIFMSLRATCAEMARAAGQGQSRTGGSCRSRRCISLAVPAHPRAPGIAPGLSFLGVVRRPVISWCSVFEEDFPGTTLAKLRAMLFRVSRTTQRRCFSRAPSSDGFAHRPSSVNLRVEEMVVHTGAPIERRVRLACRLTFWSTPPLLGVPLSTSNLDCPL
jgi:hypothetical protein